MTPEPCHASSVRVLVIAMLLVVLAACGRPQGAEEPHEPQEPMSSETLDKQDPTAHYEHHEPLKRNDGYFAGLRNFFRGDSTPDPFAGSSTPPHYYMGCGGCASGDPSNALVLLALMPAFARRRRMRCSTASSM